MGDGRIETLVSSEHHKGPQPLISWQRAVRRPADHSENTASGSGCTSLDLQQYTLFQKHWTFQESQIYLDTITLEKHCNCHIIKCHCMETQGQQQKLLSSILEKASGQPAALNKINKRPRDHQPTNRPQDYLLERDLWILSSPNLPLKAVCSKQCSLCSLSPEADNSMTTLDNCPWNTPIVTIFFPLS